MLRAIAHPLRGRILHELSARGSARAADLADALAVPANQVSFHVRQLAKYGLVEEAPELARDRRDRVWRMSQDEIDVDLRTLADTPGGKAAATVFRGHLRERAHQMVDLALAAEPGGHRTSTESALLLTQAEAEEFAREVREVVSRWQEHGRGAEEAAERRTYVFWDFIVPTD